MLNKAPAFKSKNYLLRLIANYVHLDLIKSNKRNRRNGNHFSFDLRKKFTEKHSVTGVMSQNITPKGKKGCCRFME